MAEQNEEEKIKKVVREVLEAQKQELENAGKDLEEIDEAQIQKCALDCTNAHSVALQTLQYCLAQGGKFSDPSHYNKIQDCAELCELTASFLLRDSDNKRSILRSCAKVCNDCATFCEEFKEDKQMDACGQYARAAESSCKALM